MFDNGHDPRQQAHRAFGERGEEWVAEQMRARGFTVYPTYGNSECDLILPNSTTAEVKTASRTDRQVRGYNHAWWQFSFRRNGLPNNEDLFFLVCWDDGVFLGCFVIPGAQLGADRKTIKIPRSDPAKYRGKWALYWNRWDLARAVVESNAGRDSIQELTPNLENIPF